MIYLLMGVSCVFTHGCCPSPLPPSPNNSFATTKAPSCTVTLSCCYSSHLTPHLTPHPTPHPSPPTPHPTPHHTPPFITIFRNRVLLGCTCLWNTLFPANAGTVDTHATFTPCHVCNVESYVINDAQNFFWLAPSLSSLPPSLLHSIQLPIHFNQ